MYVISCLTSKNNNIIIFNIYIAQINIQEDMIKCALHIKIESKITTLPIYNFEFTIKCENVALDETLKLNASLKVLKFL